MAAAMRRHEQAFAEVILIDFLLQFPVSRALQLTRTSDLPACGQSVIDLQSTYCFCLLRISNNV
eukprot:COSAG05_NODE_1505_length_4691_cov_73.111498_6_plen_64_part_00